MFPFQSLHATLLYHKTKDILYVKQELRHRRIESTLRYTRLINFGSDEYTVRIGNNLEECAKLLESGFECVTDYEDKIFRKRK